MKSLSQSRILIFSLNAILISCSCSSEKGSDYFSKLAPQSSADILVIGGPNGGDPLLGSVAGGASSAGVASGGPGAAGSSSSGGVSSGGSMSGGTTLPSPSDKDICDPLKEQDEEIVLGHGLVGKIYDGAPNKINHFSDLLSKGKQLNGLIYMSKLNIPTRIFDKGFPREDGTMLLNSMGQVLIENFGIEFTGQLELQAGDEPGYYEVGLISDDGVVLDVQMGSENVNIIDGDHFTPTKFFCSQQLVRMEAGKSVPIRLRYFQGPRYHLALIMMWRKVQSLDGESSGLIKSQIKNPIKETRCGIAGNKFFFDPDSDSHPQMEYLDLFDPTKRVVPWSIVNHKNFRLPVGYSNSACVKKP